MLITEKEDLDLYLDARLIEKAEQYAEDHNTSVSQLVEEFFQTLIRPQHDERLLAE